MMWCQGRMQNHILTLVGGLLPNYHYSVFQHVINHLVVVTVDVNIVHECTQ